MTFYQIASSLRKWKCGVKSFDAVWYKSRSDRHCRIQDCANPRGAEPDVPRAARSYRWRDRGDHVGESCVANRTAGDGEVDARRRAMRAHRRRELFSVAADQVQHAGGNLRRGEFEGT